MRLSECCSALPWGEEEYGICGECKEHCDFYDEDEPEVPNREFSPEQQAIIDAITNDPALPKQQAIIDAITNDPALPAWHGVIDDYDDGGRCIHGDIPNQVCD